jgi:pyruvate, orthophosphate dikinase
MTAKTDVLEQLGETALILPDLLNQALAANDRIKYCLTLLQSAREHADHPDRAAPSLQAEREASGVDDLSLDAVAAGSTLERDHQLHIPHATRVHALIVDNLRQMLKPLAAISAGDTREPVRDDRWHRRLEQLLTSLPALEADRVPGDYVEILTRADRKAGDSLHLLLMDLHRELNRLQVDIAEESVDGATVYGIAESDRTLVAAFMAGVNATAPLKFDHPGLGTTATRAGERLVIQNDIGTTDAHVLVLHVVGLTVTVMYTDIHAERLRFFQSLLDPLGFEWNARTSAPSTSEYALCVGQARSTDPSDLTERLTRLGSRLVFLIDWNRARKRLGRFLKKADAIAVLKWAADHDVGHRGFLQLGDVALVYTAMERAARAQIRYGARLDEVLGRESGQAFLQAVLRIASEGLRERKSIRLVQDEIQAELLTHFESNEQRALNLAAEHAMLIAGLAGLVRDATARAGGGLDTGVIRRFADRAKVWETRADDIVSRSRTLLGPAPASGALSHLLAEADDVADSLEEAAFLLTLVPSERSTRKGLDALRELTELLTAGAQEYVKCLACARCASPGQPRGGRRVPRCGGRRDCVRACVRRSRADRTDRARRDVWRVSGAACPLRVDRASRRCGRRARPFCSHPARLHPRRIEDDSVSAPVAPSQVFLVGGRQAESALVSTEIGGNKGANLARLDRIGLRVPPAIVLGTAFCEEYFLRGGSLGPEFPQQVQGYVRQLEEATDLRLGGRRPLLLAVRSSPPVSMPGMLDTVLNIGLTESAVHGLLRMTGNPGLAWDAYRRLVRGFGETVLGVPPMAFDEVTARYMDHASVQDVRDLDPLALRALARESADLLRGLTQRTVPEDPLTQLVQAVEAVCRSWMSPRACAYRQLNGLHAGTSTAVLIQAMVFGNAGGTSGSGVGFTRNPTSGDDELYLDFLFNAQGEDVVSGRQATTEAAPLRTVLPAVHAELERAKPRLESELRDMQDFEFTVQEGRLYFLQTRSGKRTPWAALRIANDLVASGIIDRATALDRLAAYDLDAIQRVGLRLHDGDSPVGTGMPAGFGVAVGAIAFDSATAQQMSQDGPVILVRPDISPDDVTGLASAAGIVTAHGGRTSHAAVVARQLGKACVVGCRTLRVDVDRRRCSFGDQTFREGAALTVDSDGGRIYAGRLAVVIERPAELLATIKSWRVQ